MDFWVSQRRVMLWYLEQPGVRHWWSGNKDRLNRTYVDYIDGEEAVS